MTATSRIPAWIVGMFPESCTMLVQEACDLRLRFCIPHISYNLDTKEVLFEEIWIDTKAKELYDFIQEQMGAEHVKQMTARCEREKAHR